jgi:hypothetical protein
MQPTNATKRAAAFAGPIVKRASEAATETAQGLRFVISSDSPDLAGDVVEQSGLTPAYNPVPALIDHGDGMKDMIGTWVDLRNEGKRTSATLSLLPAGISQAADLVRAIHKAGVRLAASIRFLPEADAWEPIRAPATNGKGLGEITGFRFLRAKLLECSVVTQPCNPDALQLVGKSLPAQHRAALDRLIRQETAHHSATRAKAVAAVQRIDALLSA